MSNELTTQEPPRLSLLTEVANGYGMEPAAFAATLRATCVPANTSNEQFAAFLLVCREHGLNPLTKEIYAFPSRGGGIQPIVSVDGWMRIANNHPQFDGIKFDDKLDDKGAITAITAKVYRKDRTHPVEVTEYMAECNKGTDVWKKWPSRMLRHKAAIQAIRYAFSFSGIMEPDEFERVERVRDVTPDPLME